MNVIDELHGREVGAAALDLDVIVVESGDAVDGLLCSTDNGCDTVAGGDC